MAKRPADPVSDKLYEAMKNMCTKHHEVKVLTSGAGYYIGTLDPEDGCPYCRISANYFKTREEAQQALDTRSFIDRVAMEVQYCNEGKGCSIGGLIVW